MHRATSVKKLTRLLWIAVTGLAFIGTAIAVRRILIVAGVLPAAGAGQAARFSAGFNQPPLVVVLHVLPGLLFMLLGPLQFVKGIRERHIRFHRWSGRVFMVCAYIVGLSALCMPFISLPIGGLNEAAGSVLFALFFLVALTRAWRHILRKETALHREWMIRAFAVGLAVATVRPIMATAFAFFGLEPAAFLGTAFWIGFTLHLIIAEVWINYTRDKK